MLDIDNEKEKKIILKYPELFGFPPFDQTKTLMGYGLCCNEGWFPLLEDLFEKMSLIIKEKNYDIKIVQIKTKFGDLCVYTEGEDHRNDEIKNLIRNAEQIASKTCELCGKSGSFKGKGMSSFVQCDDCFNDIIKQPPL
jgi:hypothetical protein